MPSECSQPPDEIFLVFYRSNLPTQANLLGTTQEKVVGWFHGRGIAKYHAERLNATVKDDHSYFVRPMNEGIDDSLLPGSE